MAVEDVRALLRPQLEETYGVDGAAYLMDRPPGGWSELATRGDLAALETRIDRRFTDLETHLGQRFTDIDRRFTEFDRRFTDLETHLGQRFTDFDAKLDAKLDGFDAKLDGFNAGLDARFARAFTSQLRWTVGTMIGLGAIFVAAVKL